MYQHLGNLTLPSLEFHAILIPNKSQVLLCIIIVSWLFILVFNLPANYANELCMQTVMT